MTLNEVGDAQVAQNDLAGALATYRGSFDIAERLAKSDPANAGWQADLAALHGSLGQVLVKMDRREEARDMFAKGRAIVAPLAQRSPDLSLWRQYQDGFDRELAALEK